MEDSAPNHLHYQRSVPEQEVAWPLCSEVETKACRGEASAENDFITATLYECYCCLTLTILYFICCHSNQEMLHTIAVAVVALAFSRCCVAQRGCSIGYGVHR